MLKFMRSLFAFRKWNHKGDDESNFDVIFFKKEKHYIPGVVGVLDFFCVSITKRKKIFVSRGS